MEQWKTGRTKLPCLATMATTILLTVTLVFFTTSSLSSLLPGLSPNDYESGEMMNIFAHKMVSPNNRLPYDYYTLPFCPPSSQHIEKLHNSKDTGRLGIGQILQGERSRLTGYELSLLQDIQCRELCTVTFSPDQLNLLSQRIRTGYRVRLSVDDFPVVVRRSHISYTLGYPLGFSAGNNSVHAVNHLDFIIRYHIPDAYESLTSVSSTPHRIVGFEVEPRSVTLGACANGPGADEDAGPVVLKENESKKRDITFSYSVRFIESEVSWATRYDTLLKVSSGRKRMQAFAIINSLMLAFMLTASLAVILIRTLRRDCVRYGLASGQFVDDLDDDFDVDVGWRTLKGDVFRTPANSGILCVLCGAGCQLAIVVGITLIFALIGVVSPHRRGNLISGLLAVWVLSSGFGGYVAAGLHKSMGSYYWKSVTVGVALVLPGIAFGTFFIVNLFLWMMGSIGATPLLTIFILLFLWLGVSVPLAFAGTRAGYRRKAYDFPVRTNQIPRPIPKQPTFLRSPGVHLISGMVPFGIVCIELRVILNSIYMDEFYHFFGYLIAVLTILAVTCAEVSVVIVFVKLAHGNYHWWWNSWLACASSGFYVFLYSIYYLLTSPGADAKNVISNFLFLAYSTLGSLCFALITGAIGFLSSLTFVRRIYTGSIDD